MKQGVTCGHCLQKSCCTHCHKYIDFASCNPTQLATVQVIEWKSDTKNDCKAQFCSEACFDSDKTFIPDDMHCVLCAKEYDPKWMVVVKYTQLGQWVYFRATCGEECHLKLLELESKDGNLHKQCWTCKRQIPEGHAKMCSRCKVAWYCNEECQMGNWMKHKQVCK